MCTTGPSAVIRGLDPRIQTLRRSDEAHCWIRGSSPRMTVRRGRLLFAREEKKAPLNESFVRAA